MTYPDPESKSAALHARAQQVLPDGGSRSSIRMQPYGLYLDSAAGKYVTDVDGNRYLDLNNNYTSLIHGHGRAEVTAAAAAQLARGTAYAFRNEAEIELAELLISRCPRFEKIRFMNSGTEAVMNAVKAARAFTGRELVAKCDNHYHGTWDGIEVGAPPAAPGQPQAPAVGGSPGTPGGVIDAVLVLPFNDVERSLALLQGASDRLAAVVINPFGTGMGRELPSDAWLKMLAAFCRESGALLVLDEVVSFRAGSGGSQGLRDIPADLTALGKIIGGGFPVGAVAGRAEVMRVFEVDAAAGRAPITHAGTFNANPVTMAAGLAAMRLMTPEEFARINTLGDRFRAGVTEVLELANVSGAGRGHYSIFSLELDDPDLHAWSAGKDIDATTALHRHLLNDGYFLSSAMFGVVSTAMDEGDVAPFCESLLTGLRTLKGGR